MLTFSPALQAILNQTKTKIEWSQKLNETLGSNRRVRAFRDGNPGATDPATTGVEFLNIANTGTIVSQGGNITSIGTVMDATIQNGADLTTGISVMQIEGNGQWIRGSLGLLSNNTDADPNNNVDFTMSAPPSNSCGYALGAAIRAPYLMPSGTGPTAPEIDPRRVAFMELHGYQNEDTPVVVKTVAVSVRQDDLIMEDAEVAASMGDVRVTTCSETIVFGDGGHAFEFSGLLLSMNPVCNATDNTKVLHQFLVSCKPHNRWPTYPMLDTYNCFEFVNVVRTTVSGEGNLLYPSVYQPLARLEKVTMTCVGPADASLGFADGTTRWTVVSDKFGAMPDAFSGTNYRGQNPATVPYSFTLSSGSYVAGDKFTFECKMSYDQTKECDSTIPYAFKIVLKATDGTILHTYQMRDGLPINSKFLSPLRTSTKPHRPWFNCAMMLPWESHRPKLSAKAYKFHPGIIDSYMRPSMVQIGHSTNGHYPPLNGANQMNSYNQYLAMPKWAMTADISAANDQFDPNNSPYTFDTKIYNSWSRANGWAYEPGSISGHDWYTGPGGVRIDRNSFPGPVAIYMHNPGGTRLRDGSSHQENIESWSKAYFNHSCHYVQDVKTFDSLPDAKTVYGGVVYHDNYYGTSLDYIPGAKTTHALLSAVANKGATATVDRDGRIIWNAWAVDALHAYGAPGWIALLLNSPMYVVAHKHRFISTMMAQLLGASIKNTSGFLERTGAWRWLAWLLAWKLGTNHYLGIPRALIEDRWRIDMEVIHGVYVVPTTDPNHPNYNGVNERALRGLGQPTSGTFSKSGGMQALTINSGALAYYMTTVFMGMKTMGAWDAMYNKNQKCKETLEFMMKCYDLHAIDMALDANGRGEGGYPWISKPLPEKDANGVAIDPWLNYETIEIPTSWAQWAEWYPARGQEDWLLGDDGVTHQQRDAGQHNRASWVFMRKDFFPEFPYPRLDEAVAKYQGWYDQRTVAVNAATTPWNKSVADWHFLMPGMGRIKPPYVA